MAKRTAEYEVTLYYSVEYDGDKESAQEAAERDFKKKYPKCSSVAGISVYDDYESE